MKKVLLLGFGNLTQMPYMKLYLDTLSNSEIELVYWARAEQTDAEVPKSVVQAYRFQCPMDNHIALKNKLKYFWKYRRFVCSILKKKKYDLIVSMQAAPGLTVLDKLITKYRKQYILDFRDLSYEHIPVYKLLTGILACNAKMVFVSSNAFRNYLPSTVPIYTVHNYTKDSLTWRREKENRDIRPLRVCYWGVLRGIKTNFRLISALGNDDRFELHYYGLLGNDGKEMQKYVTDNAYKNVFFHGAYITDERYGFMKSADILHNSFDLDRTMTSAVSNKLYDGAILRIPQICTKGAYMERVVTENGIGLAIDFEQENIAEKIWTYYHEIQWNTFEHNCSAFVQRVCKEQADTVTILSCVQE